MQHMFVCVWSGSHSAGGQCISCLVMNDESNEKEIRKYERGMKEVRKKMEQK